MNSYCNMYIVFVSHCVYTVVTMIFTMHLILYVISYRQLYII